MIYHIYLNVNGLRRIKDLQVNETPNKSGHFKVDQLLSFKNLTPFLYSHRVMIKAEYNKLKGSVRKSLWTYVPSQEVLGYIEEVS